MSKRKNGRKGRERIELDFTTFMRLVTTSEERRTQAEWYAGERARLIEAIAAERRLYAGLDRRYAAVEAEVRRLVEERAAIIAAIARVKTNRSNPTLYSAIDALFALLSPDDAATGAGGANNEH